MRNIGRLLKHSGWQQFHNNFSGAHLLPGDSEKKYAKANNKLDAQTSIPKGTCFCGTCFLKVYKCEGKPDNLVVLLEQFVSKKVQQVSHLQGKNRFI